MLTKWPDSSTSAWVSGPATKTRLEGALMMSRLERNSDHLLTAQKHLNGYLEGLVRV
jgi:hypothetical protein